MPWSGAGLFTRLYNFVDDAANGIKILASKQDAEWSNVVGGLNNVICRDGQNSPTADINWGGKRITNLGAAVAGSDAATYSQLLSAATAQNEWFKETGGFSYLTPTSFKILGVDNRYQYHPSRRVMGQIAGPGYCLGTIVSSAYVAPDTVVNIVWDATPIDATLAQIWYGLLSYVNPSYTSPRALTKAICNNQVPFASSPNAQRFPYDAVLQDDWNQFSTAAHTFTARWPGQYNVAGCVTMTTSAPVTTPGIAVYLVYNGTVQPPIVYGHVPGTVGNTQLISVPYSAIIQLNSGDTLSVNTGLSGTPTWFSFTSGSHLDICRIP